MRGKAFHANLGAPRVLVLHFHDAPHIPGGATAYLRRLVAVLAARGHASAVFSLDRPAEGLQAEVASYVYPWPRSAWRRRRDFHGRHLPLAEAIRAFAGRVRPDLVHVQNCAAFRTTVFPALRALGRPVVMTVHDFSLSDPNPSGRPRGGPLGPLRRWLDQRDLARARAAAFAGVDRFLCPTDALRLGVGFPAGSAELLRLPIEPAEAVPLPPPPLRLFFAGTLYRSKGVDLLLQALARARGAAAAATLEIAGSGDQEPLLRRMAAELGLESRVRFLGHLDPAAMEAAYERAALQVLPSRVAENSPLTVLEAGARGRPSVASHLGGVPELVAPPARGWTFRGHDPKALARALEDAAARPGEVAARGERMRQWVRAHFEPGPHWDKVEALYKSLLAAKGRA